MKKHKEPQFGTPYDDVFRTILNDCSSLILPVLNEIFHTNYTGEETIVFRQNEHFLNQLPFYIFTYESRFEEYEKDTDKLTELQTEYAQIMEKLEYLCNKKEINEYTTMILIDMSKKVLEHIAVKKKNIREGVKQVMGGRVLEHQAKTILNSGIEQGKIQTLIQLICRKKKKGNSTALIAKDLELEIQTVEEICNIAEPFAPDYDCEMIWQAYLKLHK